MDSLFEVSFSALSEAGKAHSRCGKCRRYMKYIQTKPARLHCAQCDETYSLPSNGTVRPYRELRCPLDDFELLAFSSGARGQSYPLCPYCYNHPPFRDMTTSGCNACSHPTCGHSMTMLGVASCVECASGVLVLDCTSAPKSWKLGCNRCDVIINIFKGAVKVTVDADTKCDECESQLVTVAYKPDETRFKDGSEEKVGCVFCSASFVPLVEKHRAVATRPVRGSGGRGRGRGRGGRGRGSAATTGRPRAPKDKMAQLAAYFV